MAFVFRSPAFFVLLGIGMLNSLGSLWYAGQFYGGEVFPVTRLMVVSLNGAFTIIPIIIAIFYAGELVWRDRDRRVHEIVDATPAPDWAFLVPKVVAITLVLTATLLVAMLAGVVVQALKGYSNFELLQLPAVVRAARRRRWPCCSPCSRCSCRCWCRTSSSAGP